jgi:hypothetical protein
MKVFLGAGKILMPKIGHEKRELSVQVRTFLIPLQ